MLKSFPTAEEFTVNDFQRGYVRALSLAIDSVARKLSGKSQYFENDDVVKFKDDCLNTLYDALHRYEPGHDKPSNYF